MALTVVSVKSGPGPGVERITCSDHREFSLNTVYLPPAWGEASFYPGRELSAEDEETLGFAAACFRAERAALRLAARAEQTVFGLSRKLERRGHGSRAVGAVVARLTELDILNDRRYAQAWARSRLARSVCGPRRLFQALCGRGIDRDDAREALKSVLDAGGEAALLRRFIAGNYPGFDGKDPFLKQQLRYAGFSAAVVQAFWEEW
jgi:regulatory protein